MQYEKGETKERGRVLKEKKRGRRQKAERKWQSKGEGYREGAGDIEKEEKDKM